MATRIDLVGLVSGRLRVMSFYEARKNSYWNCYCDPLLGGCGKENVIVIGGNLTSKNSSRRTKSCGCLATETKSNYRHGHGTTSCSRMYDLWLSIKDKCYGINHPNYKPGLTVCPEWKSDFKTFLHDVVERQEGKVFLLKEGCTEYNKENCYWGSRTEIRKRHEHPMTLHGVTKNMTAWSRELGIPLDVIHARYRKLWSDERALTQPVRGGTRGYGTYLPGSDNIIHQIRRIKPMR